METKAILPQEPSVAARLVTLLAPDPVDIGLRLGNIAARAIYAPVLDTRPLLVELAEHQLAAALHTYRQFVTGQGDQFVTYLDLSLEERAFYEAAIERWARVMWGDR